MRHGRVLCAYLLCYLTTRIVPPPAADRATVASVMVKNTRTSPLGVVSSYLDLGPAGRPQQPITYPQC